MDIAVLIFVAVIIQKIIERLRAGLPYVAQKWFDGTVVNMVAVGLGVGATYGIDLHLLDVLGQPDHADWLDRVLTGIALGFGAGFINDLAARRA